LLIWANEIIILGDKKYWNLAARKLGKKESKRVSFWLNSSDFKIFKQKGVVKKSIS